MKAALLLILTALRLWSWGFDDVANPYFKRLITTPDWDADEQPIVFDAEYDLEWLIRNGILNGNFEQWSAGAPVNWTVIEAGVGQVTGGGVGEYVHRGSAACWFYFDSDNPGSAGVRSTRFRVNVYHDYHLSFWARKALGDASSKLYYQYRFLNSAGSVISSSSATDVWSSLSAGTYIHITDEVTKTEFPAGTVYIDLFIYAQYVSGAAPEVYIDDVSFFRELLSTDPLYSAFAILNSGDYETFTFPCAGLLVGSSPQDRDDTQIVLRAQSGNLTLETNRWPLKRPILVFRVTSYAALCQLARFHAKVRGESFVYVDETGVESTVIWPGSFGVASKRPSKEVWEINIPLEFAAVTPGE